MAKRARKTNFIGSKRHALFFFLIYIVGGLILTFEKQFIGDLFPNSRFPEALIIGTAFILMGTYVFFVTLVPATKLRTDIAADNVYYLGFLYTLTSLAVAISVDEPETILANFGVAIVSTLIGIAARVGLNQLRVDPTDIEEATRLELSDATRRVRSEIDETVQQIANFRNLSMQVMSEGYEEVRENIEKASKELLKSIEEVVEQSTEPLIELAEKTQHASEQAVEAISEVTKSNQKLAKSSKTMTDGIEKANEALAGLAEHYSDTGVLDEKILEKVEAQMIAVKEEIKNLVAVPKVKTKENQNSKTKKTKPIVANKSDKKSNSKEAKVEEKNASLPKRVLQAFEEILTSSTVHYKGKMIKINKDGAFVDGANFQTVQLAKSYIDTHNDR